MFRLLLQHLRTRPSAALRHIADRICQLSGKVAELEHSLEVLRLQREHVMGASGESVFLLGDDLCICVLNQAAERFIGRPALAAVGGSFLMHFAGADREVLQVMIDELKSDPAQTARRSVRLRVPGMDGRDAMPIEITIARTGRYGERFYTATVRDIAEIEKSEHTKALLAALVHSSRDAIISFSHDQRIASWNEGAERMFGYTAEEAIGAPADLLVPAGRDDGPSWYFERVLKGGSFTTETVRKCKSGCLLDVFISVAPIRNVLGETVGVSAIMHDVTERRRDEARLRQAEIVFSSSQEGLAITDSEMRVVAVNPAFEGITGYAESEIAGRHMSLLQSERHSTEFYAQMWRSVEHEGSWQGEVWCARRGGGVVPSLMTISSVRGVEGELQNYVATLSDISHIKDSERRLEHVAHYDALTNLPNRRLLLPQLQVAIERARFEGTVGAVLFVDLDRFKMINDSMGHSAGDDMLLAVVERFKEHLRPTDILARFGGDEFVIVLEGLKDKADAGRVAELLIGKLKESGLTPGENSGEIFMGASIGISVFPDDADEASRVIQNADTALYGAKTAGRGCYRYYDVALTLAASVRLQREARMRRAIEREEFILHYQPLYSLATGRMTGVEALVRWQDPVAGLVPPSEFIPIAEDTGLIVQLGEWVLRRACEQMCAWRASGADIETMAVNISPRQFQQAELVDRLRAILDETRLEPRFLELELTESALAEDGDSVQLKLAAMKRIGVRLAIDDFGTGYSSLSYLRRFPIDKLKVDRSFVRDIGMDVTAAEIAGAIIGLGRNLGLEVLAEGVETEQQKAFLVQQGCQTAQGYLFSKPVPADWLEAMLFPAPAPAVALAG